MIGYGSHTKAYRLWDPSSNRILDSFHVTFVEHLDAEPAPLHPGIILGLESTDAPGSWDAPTIPFPSEPPHLDHPPSSPTITPHTPSAHVCPHTTHQPPPPRPQPNCITSNPHNPSPFLPASNLHTPSPFLPSSRSYPPPNINTQNTPNTNTISNTNTTTINTNITDFHNQQHHIHTNNLTLDTLHTHNTETTIPIPLIIIHNRP